MATGIENVVENAETADVDGTVKGKKDKKSYWRDIEKMKDKLRLLKALREIDANYDPYSRDEFMKF